MAKQSRFGEGGQLLPCTFQVVLMLSFFTYNKDIVMVKNACLLRACFNDARRALVYFKGYFRILYTVIGQPLVSKYQGNKYR